MLGRLFASNAASGLSAALNSVKDDTPISVLEEADTRALLYGSSSGLNDVNMDLTGKDIRVVVLVDMNSVEDYIFDSSRHADVDSVQHGNIRGGPSSPTLASATISSPSSISPFSPGRMRHGSARRTASASFIHSSPTSPTGASSPRLGVENVPFQTVKQVVFGHTAMRFQESVTKLHPIASSNDKSRRTWIASRLFKVGTGNPVDLDMLPPTHIDDGDESPPVASSYPSTFSHIRGETDAKENVEQVQEVNDWMPSSLPSATISATGSTFDINCGFSIFFNLSADSGVLTAHWDELSVALSDFERTLHRRLCDVLPGALRERRARGGKKQSLNLDMDEEIRSAVDFFKTRFFGIVKIPRVICGQDRWADVWHELKWLLTHYDTNTEGSGFVSTVLASFIKCNQNLLTNGMKLQSGAIGDPPTRTIVVGLNRIPARRLIFILTSMLHDESTARASKLQKLPSSFTSDKLVVGKTRSVGLQSQNNSASSSPASRISRSSTMTSAVLNEKSGWEIPKSGAGAGETNSSCTMPHVVRPTFSNNSLSTSLSTSRLSTSISSSTRLPSIDGIRRTFFGHDNTNSSNFGNLFTSTSSSNSLFSSFFTSRSSSRSEVGSFSSNTSVEDYGYDPGYTDLSTSLPSHPAGLPVKRWHSSDRTATMMLSGRKQSQLSHKLSQTSFHDTEDDEAEDCACLDEDMEYELADEEGCLVVEVQPPECIDSDNHFKHQGPLILPPIAGHVPEFHPEFGIQAVTISRELEQKINSAMMRDAERVPTPPWSKSNRGAESLSSGVPDGALASEDLSEETVMISRSLIVNLTQREIFEYSLVRTCSGNGCSQKILRQKLFSGSKALGEYLELSKKVSSCLQEALEVESGAEAVEIVKNGIETCFGIA